jgi:ribosomal protein S18 acetylase RimI-like enzyme
MRLRGMAVEPQRQGLGIGALLVHSGVQRYLPAAGLVWAHARDPVLGFYERLGFVVVGEGFIDAATAIPHHVVLKHLN